MRSTIMLVGLLVERENRKQDDPYPIPARTQHFHQPVPNTNPYPIPTRTIYLTHVMACNARLSGRCQGVPRAGGGAADVSSRCHAKRAYNIPVYQVVPYTSNTEHPQLVPYSLPNISTQGNKLANKVTISFIVRFSSHQPG